MKCKKEYVEAALIKLITQIASTMPSSMYKFLIGGAATFASLKSSKQIGEMLNFVSDEEDGLVDVTLLKKMIDGAFNSSGGKLQMTLFDNQGFINLFVKPISLTITKEDIDVILKDIEINSVQTTNLSLSPQQPQSVLNNTPNIQ